MNDNMLRQSQLNESAEVASVSSYERQEKNNCKCFALVQLQGVHEQMDAEKKEKWFLSYYSEKHRNEEEGDMVHYCR